MNGTLVCRCRRSRFGETVHHPPAGLDSPPVEVTCYVYPAPAEIEWTGGVANGAGVRLEMLPGGTGQVDFIDDTPSPTGRRFYRMGRPEP